VGFEDVEHRGGVLLDAPAQGDLDAGQPGLGEGDGAFGDDGQEDLTVKLVKKPSAGLAQYAKRIHRGKLPDRVTNISLFIDDFASDGRCFYIRAAGINTCDLDPH